MLGLESERASHAAAAGVQQTHIEPRDQLDECSGAGGADQRLLMAMPVDEGRAPARCGGQGQIANPLPHALRQPSVG